MKLKLNESKKQGMILASKDAEGKEWDVVLIAVGKSENVNSDGSHLNYSKELLKKSVDKFNNVKSFALELKPKFFSHLPHSLRAIADGTLVKNIVGWFSNAKFGSFKDKEGRDREGILARWHISDNAKWLRDLLKDAWKNNKKNLLELSIDAEGTTEVKISHGEKIQDVLSFDGINSVDVVTAAAAGGQLLRLVASYDAEIGGIKMDKWLEILRETTEIDSLLTEGIDPENILEEQKFSLTEKLLNLKEDKNKFQERLGFYTKIVDEIIDMVNADKKEQAVRLLNDLKQKFVSYGYAYPTYGYPQESALGYGRYGYVSKIKTEEASNTAPPDPQDSDKEEEMGIRECAIMLKEQLLESGLPKVVEEKLRKTFANKIFTELELREAILDEKEMLASLSNSGKIQGLGKTVAEHGTSKNEKFAKAMQGMMEGVDIDGVPRFRSLHQSYRVITGFQGSPKEIGGRVANAMAFSFPGSDKISLNEHRSMLENARSVRMTEALETTDWPIYFSDAMYRMIIKEYSLTQRQDWRKVVSDITSPPDFRVQKRLRYGSFADLADVAEGGPYTQFAADKSEEKESYSVTKRGKLYDVSYESIVDDDLGQVKRLPRNLAQAALRTIYKKIFDIFTTNPTMGDSLTLFHASHNNLGALTFSADNLLTSIENMMAQTDPDGNDYLNIMPKYVIASRFLIHEIVEVLTSPVKITTNYDATVPSVLKTLYDLNWIVPDYWTSTTAWYLLADPQEYPTIEVGFLDGQEEPEIWVANQPTIGTMFSDDKIQYKVRHIYGYIPLDYRTFYANTP